MDNNLLNQTVPNYSVAAKLAQIAQEEGVDPTNLAKIFLALPISDAEDVTYLDGTARSILDISSLVDQELQSLSYNLKTATKLRLMGKLLLLKADSLVESY